MLIGLPASGKSTLAKELSIKENAVILSSDEIRVELLNDVNDQSDNTNVFEAMNSRAKQLLEQGNNVIYDATNINRKRRIHLIKNELKASENVAYYLNTPMSMCVYNDSQRERTVGYEVIDKMYRTLQIPTKLEGWDEVKLVNDKYTFMKEYKTIFEFLISTEDDHDSLFYELAKIIPEFNDIVDVPQDSSYHSFSISRHIYHTYLHVKNYYDRYNDNRYMENLIAALFHDLGKGHCKSFHNHKGELKKYASFIGHEFVSAQLASEYLVKLGYDDEFVKYVADLIQFHMTPMNMSEKQEKKLRELLTEEQYNDLMFLHEADLQAK